MRNAYAVPRPSLGEDLNILDLDAGDRIRANARLFVCVNGHRAPRTKDGLRCLWCKRETDARAAKLYRARKSGRAA